MTKDAEIKPFKLNTTATRMLLISAQLVALIIFILALEFLRHTTGGTLFLFSTIGPVLAMLAVLATLGVATYRFLRRHSLFVIEEIEPGEVVFRQGEEGDCAYFIHEGEFAVVREENGAENVIARLSNGQYFGEMALISEAPRNATVRAVTPAKVAILGKANFLTMMKVMPVTQEDIMKRVGERAMRSSAK
jgi:hypothetical protein